MSDTSLSVPPPPLHGSQMAMFALPYTILFFIGTLGNVGVLTYVFFITRSLRSSVTALGNTFLYMVCLSGVDLLVTISIPFHLSAAIMDNWMFGHVACKVYYLLELSNKMCSTFILTALAFDRYMAICHPEIKRVHHMRLTLLIVCVLIALSVGLIMPVVFSSKVIHRSTGSVYITPQRDGTEGVSHEVVKAMCADGLSSQMRLWVSGSLVVTAFLLPCTLLTFFYAKIVLRLRKQIRTMLQSRIPIKRITVYTLVVTLFYLACQVPYWLPQIYVMTCMLRGLPLSNSKWIHITYISHIFPFVSAAFNWIFYAQLNSQFKKGLILVTERMNRKMTRNGGKRGDTMDELCIEMMSRSEDAVCTVCPNCEHPLSVKVHRLSSSLNGTANGNGI